VHGTAFAITGWEECKLMKIIVKSSEPQIERRAHPRRPSQWRIGDATVSTDELQAWQLGPANVTRLFERRAPSSRGESLCGARG
jgi:hypothetical protein